MMSHIVCNLHRDSGRCFAMNGHVYDFILLIFALGLHWVLYQFSNMFSVSLCLHDFISGLVACRVG